MTKPVIFGFIALILSLANSGAGHAQSGNPPTPTTHILAIGTLNPGVDPTAARAAAHEMLEKLPLGQAHLMSFELIPLGPLNPLRQLQGMAPGSP
jgi:hypothetical protein